MFAYGLNTNIGEMRCRHPQAVLIGPAWLDGYGFAWRRFADIELDPDRYTIGLLWQVSDEDLDALDRFEGVPRHYIRQRVRISTQGGEHTGWAYMMARQDAEMLPDGGYLDAVLAGYRVNNLSDQQLVAALQRLSHPDYL